ncbi:MAG TPA: hypothetical protein VF613_04275, partial [Longimicrobium sp.]
HRLFDRGLIGIGDDLRVHVNAAAWKAASDFDRERLRELDGTPLRVPTSASLRPDPELIRRRNSLPGLNAGSA